MLIGQDFVPRGNRIQFYECFSQKCKWWCLTTIWTHVKLINTIYINNSKEY